MDLTKKTDTRHKIIGLIMTAITLLLIMPPTLTAMSYTNSDKKEAVNVSHFIWKIDGIDAYASPTLDNDPVDRLSYGDDVDILDILHDKTEEVRLQHAYNHQVDGEQHTHLAKWVKVSYLEDIFYVLDTYLIAVEPPVEDEAVAFVFEHYLEDLSPVLSSDHQGKTIEFCERKTFEYANGVRYTMTDFGPCEQCGHAQAIVYFPHLDLREGLVMAILFVDFFARYEESAPHILHQIDPIPLIEVQMEFGMISKFEINIPPQGVEIIVDMYM